MSFWSSGLLWGELYTKICLSFFVNYYAHLVVGALRLLVYFVMLVRVFLLRPKQKNHLVVLDRPLVIFGPLVFFFFFFFFFNSIFFFFFLLLLFFFFFCGGSNLKCQTYHFMHLQGSKCVPLPVWSFQYAIRYLLNLQLLFFYVKMTFIQIGFWAFLNSF